MPKPYREMSSGGACEIYLQRPLSSRLMPGKRQIGRLRWRRIWQRRRPAPSTSAPASYFGRCQMCCSVLESGQSNVCEYRKADKTPITVSSVYPFRSSFNFCVLPVRKKCSRCTGWENLHGMIHRYRGWHPQRCRPNLASFSNSATRTQRGPWTAKTEARVSGHIGGAPNLGLCEPKVC